MLMRLPFFLWLRVTETLPAVEIRFLGVNAVGIYAIIMVNRSHANLFVMTFIDHYNLKAECFKPKNR